MSLLRQSVKFVLARTVPRRRLLVRGGPEPAPGSPQSRDSIRHSALIPQHFPLSARIALTFDDGPHPEHTPRVLDRLAEAGVRATFFVIGREAERRPELVRRIHADGHVLGNHSYSHGEPGKTAPSVFLDEIDRTRSLLEDLLGEPCCLVRPPKGALTVRKLWGLWRRGQTVVLWNVDPRDYRMHSAADVRLWCARYEPHAGDIVLLHDNRPHGTTVAEELAVRRQYGEVTFVSISDFLEPSNGDGFNRTLAESPPQSAALDD